MSKNYVCGRGDDLNVGVMTPSSDVVTKVAQPNAQVGTIFHQDWWLDVASGGAWGKAEVKQDIVTVGVWPYAIRRQHFATRLDMPPYTRVLGPLLNLPVSKPTTRLENACEVIDALHNLLPCHHVMRHYMAPEHDETMALVLLGKKVEHTGCTFRLLATIPQDVVLQNMKGRTRRDIKRAQNELTVQIHHNLDEYIKMATAQVAIQGDRRGGHRFDVLARLFDASVLRDQSVMLTAKEGNDSKAVAILLYDQQVLYFWLGARKIEPSNRAYTFLIWEAFRFAQSRGLTFDLDGFWSLTSGQYLASFGATPVHRPMVKYQNNMFSAASSFRDMLRSLRPKLGGRL